MKENKQRIYIPLMLFLIFSSLAAFLFLYNNYLNTKLWEQNLRTLKEIETQQIYNFNSKLSQDVKTIEAFSHIITSHVDYKNFNTLSKQLDDFATNSDFEIFGYSNLNGEAITSENETIPVSNQTFFINSSNGLTYISEPLKSTTKETPVRSKSNDANVIIVSTPVFSADNPDKIVGILFGSYNSKVLNSLLLPSADSENCTFVISDSGEIVAKSENVCLSTESNILEYLEQNSNFLEYDDLNTIKMNIRSNHNGYSIYETKDEKDKYILLYNTIKTNNWNIFSSTSEASITSISSEIIQISLTFSLFMAILFLGFTFFIFYSQQKNSKMLEKIAYYDEFTGAPTLTTFKIQAQKYVNEAKGTKNFIMVKFDIENFKLLNQILGYDTGNQLILNIVKTLKEITPGKYLRYARVRDDEFLVLHEYIQPDDIMKIRENFITKVLNGMGENFDYSFKVVSGYYYMTKDNCTDVTTALERANVAHRKSKKAGIPLTIYNEDFILDDIKRKEIENKMEGALNHEDFKVFLQPKYRLKDETIGGAEALVRWFLDDKIIAYPNDFIPVFEENGFIINLDMYMFEQVCKIIKSWIDRGIIPVPISVNFSRLHLANPNFTNQLCHIADKYNVDHSLLEVELLENSMMDNIETLHDTLHLLHKNNFKISMDDFGTGYSSLGFLRDIDIDIMKIDRSFFLSANNNSRAKSVLVNVLNLAHNLNIFTVAEGVEEKAHIELLKQIGCNMVQGYYYARPMPVDEFEKKLENKY